MRTIPTAISDGLTNHDRLFWLVKLEASGGVTKYWTTAGKNRAGNAFTLKETSGGGALAYDSTMIAEEVDGESRNGIGPMESGIDLMQGGGAASVSDVEIEILNFDRFDKTIIQAGINIEYRPVTIYLGCVPAGATPVIVIADDMLKRWAGVVEENEHDFTGYTLRCIDGSFKRHKDIPTTVITKTTYPNAPKENIGKSIPMVYGAFGTVVDTENEERELETFGDPVPCIRIHDQLNKFIVCDHAVHTLGRIYVRGDNNLFGLLPMPTDSTITPTTTFYWDNTTTTVDITAEFYQQPKKRGSLMAGADAYTHEAAVDDSLSTQEAPLLSDATPGWFVALDNPVKMGTLASRNVTIRMRVGTITGTVRLRAYNGTSYTNGTNLTSANSNSTVSFSFDLWREAGLGLATIEDFVNHQFGIGGNASGGVEIKNVCIIYTVFPTNFGRADKIQIIRTGVVKIRLGRSLFGKM